ncbi:hypothetical protein VRK_37490 [Vibrio sp. MEBiC08052]|nr:hypothetical protein VRK_37490 [Vibrio sp. MEBiC08052]
MVQIESLEIALAEHCNLKCYGCDHRPNEIERIFINVKNCQLNWHGFQSS